MLIGVCASEPSSSMEFDIIDDPAGGTTPWIPIDPDATDEEVWMCW